MRDSDISSVLQQHVTAAIKTATPLCIHGGNSKFFYGRTPLGTPIDISPHAGIINYEPTELVITARAGTRIHEIETLLTQHQQMLAFEPTTFGGNATLGGTIACNTSGPRRAYAGAARDFVLGVSLLNGRGEILSFGGEVMKNVAGYDVSRLMTGALGTLGILLSVSLKVLPKPEVEITLMQQTSATQALTMMQRWAQLPLPISATCFVNQQLYVRLAGTRGAVLAAQSIIGGDTVATANTFWQQLNEQQHSYFQATRPLWLLSIASNTPPINIDGDWLYEWNGARRWLLTEVDADTVRTAASAAGGHATQYRNHASRAETFHPLSPALLKLHRQLKIAFDPHGIFNPGRMYQEL